MPPADKTRPRSGVQRLPRLLIAGAEGRLGSAIVRLAVAQGYPVTAGLVRERRTIRIPRRTPGSVRLAGPSELPELLSGSDVFVSATTPEAERRNLPEAARRSVPAIVATSGLRGDRERWFRAVTRRIPVVHDANFSEGIHLLRKVVRSLGRLPEGYDVSLIETHRAGKRDAPSATAKAIAGDLAAIGLTGWEPVGRPRRANRAQIASLRGGETPGIHTVQIEGPRELLRLEHLAYGREAFAEGILASAKWLHQRRRTIRPGLYSLDDVLGEERGG